MKKGYQLEHELRFTYKNWGIGFAIGIDGPWGYDVVSMQIHMLCLWLNVSLKKYPDTGEN